MKHLPMKPTGYKVVKFYKDCRDREKIILSLVCVMDMSSGGLQKLKEKSVRLKKQSKGVKSYSQNFWNTFLH